MLTILAVLPLIVAAFLGLLLRKSPRNIKYIALIASLISLVIILAFFFSPPQIQSTTWFTLNGYQFTLSASTAPLSMLLLIIVGIMTPIIVLYSIGFMDVPSEQARYYFELCIFASAMMLFAMSADFITMFIGWELLGVTSYLLIGFWYQREGTQSAARKAITTILIGDILMFIAIILIWNSYHTLSFQSILQQNGSTAPIGFALVLIMLAAFTKSAQFPFHGWLPDAMKGPTPISAFVHSSTMVKAGIFIVAVLLPLFVASHLLYLLVIFGIITAIIGATNALSENHIKRILAFSTIEDLGLMFIALGTGSVIAAMILFVVQAFYKALLFLCAGSIMKANGNEEDIRKLYISSSYLNIFIPTAIGVASLAGLFPLGGFFGKAAVGSVVASTSIPVYLILLVVELVSNIYIFRWLFVPLRNSPDKKSIAQNAKYKIIPKSMQLPIYVLTALVVIGSISYIYLPGYLSSYGSANFGLVIEAAVTTAVLIIGFYISYLLFYKKGYLFNENSTTYKTLHNISITDAAYSYVVEGFAFVSELVERFDYSLYNAIKGGGHGLISISDMLKKAENGSTNTYLAAFIIGLIVLVIIFIM